MKCVFNLHNCVYFWKSLEKVAAWEVKMEGVWHRNAEVIDKLRRIFRAIYRHMLCNGWGKNMPLVD